MCYAITDAAQRKKLDDHSRCLVHLGTEPGYKSLSAIGHIKEKNHRNS